MSTQMLRSCIAGMLLVAITVGVASAQCNTCAAPTVAYQPVVAQPVVAQPTVAYRPYTGWYPGKWLDQWRLRRAGVATTIPAYSPAPTYTAAYAPTYTAAYTPASYTAAYAPTYTAAYRPYVTAFAPLSTPVATTCNTCTQTVARPVLMRPVVASACDTCSFTPSCGCDSCSTGVSQAVYSDTPGCSSCASSSAGVSSNVLPPANAGQPATVGPPTTQPSLAPVPAPNSQYNSQRPIQGSGSREIDAPANDVDPLDQYDPGPVETESDSSTWYNAPQLLDPRDRTAARTYHSRQPTVDVRTAIYRNGGQNQGVSTTRPTGSRTRTQAEIDADGWSAVPR
ncbi:MAG: hypothetical protein AAGD11_19300 [Planctomycetota bacterium]